MKWFKIYLVFCGFASVGQLSVAPKPIAKFLKDSVYLGEIFDFSVVFKHDSKVEIFFPENSLNFAPFEMVEKLYYPTKTINNVSIDSAIYKIRTFSVQKTQSLALPIFMVKQGDSTAIFSEKDSVSLIQLITTNLNNAKLNSPNGLLPMKSKINVLLLFFQIAIAFILSLLWWVIFGKLVKSQFKIFQAYRQHNEFKNLYGRFTKNTSRKNIEKALIVWKKYMGKLQKKSFLNLTTPEILENIPDQNLAEALKEIDKSIYGNLVSEKLPESFSILNELAENQYKLAKKIIFTAKS